MNRILTCLAATALSAVAAQAQNLWNSPNFPPLGGVYTTRVPAPQMISYGGGVGLRFLDMRSSGPNIPPPPPGGPVFVNSFFDVFTEITFDGGGTWFPSQHPDTIVGLQIMNGGGGGGGTQVFDTEMLSMNLSGVGFSGCLLRESPTRASTGRTSVTDVGNGQYHIDSFFDVFTEISLDNGQTWSPSEGSARMNLVPEPATMAALGIGAVALIKRRKGKQRP